MVLAMMMMGRTQQLAEKQAQNVHIRFSSSGDTSIFIFRHQVMAIFLIEIPFLTNMLLDEHHLLKT